MNQYIIDALKKGRKAKGLRQVDVATAIGVSDITIGNYEKGVSEPRIDDLAKIFALYDMSFSEVIRTAYEPGITKYSAFVKEVEDKLRKQGKMDAKVSRVQFFGKEPGAFADVSYAWCLHERYINVEHKDMIFMYVDGEWKCPLF